MATILTLYDGTDRSNVRRLTDTSEWVRGWHHWNQRGPRENPKVRRDEMPWGAVDRKSSIRISYGIT